MAKGNKILVSAERRGRDYEGPINGTPKPGTVMQIDVSAGINDNGQFTFEPFTTGDGLRPIGPYFILLEDKGQGKPATEAYANGDHGYLYVPALGEQFNMLLQDVAGTGDDHTLGQVLIVDSGTGKLIATTGTPESEPFMLLETVTDPTADTLARVIYTGY